jgi:hypothetical protein
MTETPTMTVYKLATLLLDLPPDLPVYIWDNGERFAITDVDDSFAAKNGWVDVNMTKGKEYEL